VKYLLLIHLNPTLFETLSEDERQAIFGAHAEFEKLTGESGELVASIALADPSTSTVVRTKDGAATVTDGPYVESKEFLAGYYLVDCETRQRAEELAALIPDSALTGIEVRAVMRDGADEL
jgi:hypothetical protein